MAIAYPLCTVALHVVLCSLNSPDHIYLFHPICIYIHSAGHLPNRIEVHFVPSEHGFLIACVFSHPLLFSGALSLRFCLLHSACLRPCLRHELPSGLSSAEV